VWALLSLLCLSVGPHRVKEADSALRQALRLGLDSLGLLRELAVAYLAVDRHSTAEELVRRACVQERYCIYCKYVFCS
jgi:Flp pilus assembly protein TadD